MRTNVSAAGLAVVLLSLAPSATRAQVVGHESSAAAVGAPPPLWPTPLASGIEFGARGTGFDDGSDRARFQRYRDLRKGGTLDRVRFSRETAAWTVDLQADHVGYRDQRYAASLNRYGKIKASFAWDQVPLFYSVDTRTPYTEASPGVLRIESRVAPETGEALARAGHIVEWWPDYTWEAGSICMIRLDARSGVKFGAADPRRSAHAVGW